MKTFAFTTALVLAAAAPAFANDQLARSLGLEPGVFTTSELATIAGYVEERDSTNDKIIANLVSRTGGGVVSTQSVDDGQFTALELAQIAGLVEERDHTNRHHIAALMARAGAGSVSTQSVPGSSQLAASLGLDAGQFTAVELAQIAGLVEERDHTNRGQIARLIAR